MLRYPPSTSDRKTWSSLVFTYGLLSWVTFGAGLCLVLVDAALRNGDRFLWMDHALGAGLLLWAGSGTAALLLLLVFEGERAALASWRRIVGDRGVTAFTFALRTVAVTGASYPTAAYAFSGAAVAETWWAWLGAPTLALLCGVGTATVGLASSRSQATALLGRPRPALFLAAGATFVAALTIWIDLTVYPFLYEPLHTLLEVCALAFLGTALFLRSESRARQHPRFVAGWAGLTAAATGLVILPTGAVDFIDRRLAHTWLQELYVGRSVQRVQELQAGLAGYEDFDLARRAQLIERFGIEDTSLDPRWRQARRLTRRPELEGIENIAVFYVDTLREDVTRVPGLMPRLAKFRQTAFDFRKAYAVGSDTLRSLPAMTSGNQFIQHDSPGDLLRLATDSNVTSLLVSAESAAAFLRKLRPEFTFEKTVTVADAERGKQVWGYGAHRPTAKRIVTKALDLLHRTGDDEPFLLWMLHFDQHAWRELEATHIQDVIRRNNLLEGESELDLRYRAVAASIDEQFGRFLDGLDASGKADRTAVLFVSDHGEGLGQEGFWVHSVFLWNSLIHVPLALRIPGTRGRRVETAVSLIDIAPTLAPLLGGTEGVYHGENLIEIAQQSGPPNARKNPIILRSATSDRLSRVGIIDSGGERKLVVRIQALFPELYQLGDPLDRHNLAARESEEVRRLLRLVARSPAFPREERDFALLGSRGPLGVHAAQASLE